jgi:hypothetical protein
MSCHHKGLLRGAKFNRRHSTVIDIAVPIIKAAKVLEEIHKIILGDIAEGGSGSTMKLNFSDIPAGLKMIVKGANIKQTFYLYTKAPEAVKAALNKVWEDERR